MATQKNTVGSILMLDVSGSMYDALARVKINAQAFISELLLPDDQFGINQFSDNASWVYPTKDQKIVKVSADYKEVKEASVQIEGIRTYNMTNMGEAIKLGNAMIKQATTDRKSFVILSDGVWNVKPYPEDILTGEPPIYVAGLGSSLTPSRFEPLLKKNSASKYYHSPDVAGMMEMFNDIRGEASHVNVLANKNLSYSGSNYKRVPVMVSSDTGEAQFSFVWPDKRFKYTSKEPGGFNMRIYLLDPDNKKIAAEPTIVGDGYCIYNLKNARKGQWNALVEYSLPQSVIGTIGSFEFDSSVKMNIEAASFQSAGEPLDFKVDLSDNGQPIEDLKIDARILQPTISVDNALRMFEPKLMQLKSTLAGLNGPQEESNPLANLNQLRLNLIEAGQGDILALKPSIQTLSFSKDGFYKGVIRDTKEAGSYTVEVTVSGTSPVTGTPFEIHQRRSVFVK